MPLVRNLTLLGLVAWFFGALLCAQEPGVPSPPPPAQPQQTQPQQGQQPQPAAPHAQEPAPSPAPRSVERGGERAQEPQPGAQEPEGARRGGRGRRGRRGDGAAGPEGQGGEEGEGEQDGAVPEPKAERRGLRVDDPLTVSYCVRCHARDPKGLMTRISFMRKSPEGWSESLKRMIRVHGLQIAPDDAKAIVRYLGDEHGLTRSEATRSLYESERRVHWSEEHEDADFRAACSVCHTLGRVLAQARDPEEWQLLRATHVAMFPLARGQMGGGPPPDDDERFGPGGGGNQGQRGGRRGGGATPGAGAAQAAQAQAQAEAARRGGQQGDRGDRVLAQLADKQPLFSDEWDAWAQNRRDVPLAGTWTVTGHEVGRGDLLGTAEITRKADGDYEVHWVLSTRDGSHIDRRGRGLLYGGCAWRGRSTDAGDGGRTWREVLLLDERWDSMRGRFFTGDYDEVGADVQLQRLRGQPRALAVETPWVTVPALQHAIDVFGEAFPADVAAGDFHLGTGVTVQRCERIADNHVKLWLDVAPGTACGVRDVAYGSAPAAARIQLYDAVDYVRIRPTQGLARIGGVNFPKQIERFEAVAVQRGPDEKPYTDDDVDLWSVPASWHLTEAITRDDDDDLRFVGALDPQTGVFTPSIEGPNQQRKWTANNTGDVYVECTVDLHVPVRPAPPPPPPDTSKDNAKDRQQKPDAARGEHPGDQRGAETDAPRDAQHDGPDAAPKPALAAAAPAVPAQPAPVPTAAELAGPKGPTGAEPVLAMRTFRARASLIVTVPQYIRWTSLDWEDR